MHFLCSSRGSFVGRNIIAMSWHLVTKYVCLGEGGVDFFLSVLECAAMPSHPCSGRPHRGPPASTTMRAELKVTPETEKRSGGGAGGKDARVVLLLGRRGVEGWMGVVVAVGGNHTNGSGVKRLGT